MATNIDDLQIKVETHSTKAEQKLKNLEKTLRSLKKVAENSGLDKTVAQLKEIASLNFSNLSPLVSFTTNVNKNLSTTNKKMKEISKSAKQVSNSLSLKGAKASLSSTNGELSKMGRNLRLFKEPLKLLPATFGNTSLYKAQEFSKPKGDPGSFARQKVGSIKFPMDTVSSIINATTQADILKMKLLAVQTKLSEIMNSGNPDPMKMASLISQAKSLQAQLDSLGGKTNSLKDRFSAFGKTAVKSARETLKKFTQLIKIVLVYGGAFQAVMLAQKGVAEGLDNISKYSKETAANMNELSTTSLYLKNSIGAALYPVIVSLLPTIEALSNAIVKLLNAFNQFIAALGGSKTYIRAKRYMKEYGTEIKKTGAELKRFLAGFDELNVINTGKGGGGGAGTPDYSQMFEKADIGSKIQAVVENIQANVELLKMILGGALLVIGAILVFSTANVPLGLGMMVAGGYVLAKAVKEDWTKSSKKIESVLEYITIIVSTALLAIGAAILFSGANIPLGLALLIGGAITLATAVSEKWEGIPNKIKSTIAIIGIALGAASLVIGTVLAFTGAAIPLGIALMITGALEVATAVTTSWDKLPNKVKTQIRSLLGYLGTAFLALGVILCVTGVGIPLGIALIILGVASIVAAAAIDWNKTKTQVKNALASITAIASLAGLALGVILCLTGAALPIGIALIYGAMKGAKKADEISSNPVTKWVKKLMNSVIDIFERGLNWIINKINGLSFKIPDIVPRYGGKTFGLSLSNISIPRLRNGGFPDGENGLFYANSSEMVGRFSNGRTAVANNEQIVDGIAKGVYDAIMAAQSEDGNSSSVNIYIGEDKVGEAAIKYHNNIVKQTGSSPLFA